MTQEFDDRFLLDDSSGDHTNYAQIPNIVDRLDISPYAYRLYAHLKHIAWKAKSGGGSMATSSLAEDCHMSMGQVSQCKKELVEAGLINIRNGKSSGGSAKPPHIITIVNIWEKNAKYFHSLHEWEMGDSHSPRERENDISHSPREILLDIKKDNKKDTDCELRSPEADAPENPANQNGSESGTLPFMEAPKSETVTPPLINIPDTPDNPFPLTADELRDLLAPELSISPETPEKVKKVKAVSTQIKEIYLKTVETELRCTTTMANAGKVWAQFAEMNPPVSPEEVRAAILTECKSWSRGKSYRIRFDSVPSMVRVYRAKKKPDPLTDSDAYKRAEREFEATHRLVTGANGYQSYVAI